MATVLLPAPAAAQQEEADVLVAQAVLAYEEKRYQDALAALQEALQADPENTDALYYTGLVRVALGQPEQAVEALEKARALHPADEAIQFQLGVVYFSLSKYDQAVPLLEAVFEKSPKLDGLGYYVGFMRYRTKNYQGALRAFRAGASADPNIQQLTLFYSGLALGILGLPERAAGEIAEAMRLAPASPLTGPAERLRESVGGARERERPYHLEVRVGGFYDDNVSVIPQDSPDPLIRGFLSGGSFFPGLRNQKHTSPGWLSSFRADYSFLRLGALEATASYSLFSNQNNDINRFSIVDNMGALGATYRGGWESPFGVLPYQGAVQYSYDYLTLNGDEFVTRHTVSPFFTLVEGEQNVTSLQFRYQHKRYASSPNPIQAEKRDGSNYMAGFLHIVRFEGDKHLVKAGYQLDYDFTQGANFVYFGNRFLAGGQYTLPWEKPFANLRLSYDFDVHLRRYRNFNTTLPLLSPNTKPREDNEFTHVLRLVYPLSGNVPFLSEKIPGTLSLSADFQASIAKSNMEVFTYNRNVVSLSLIWSY